METSKYDAYQDEAPLPERPDFLKILCILSFVACGLWILVCALGTTVLTFDEETIDKAWSQMIASNPQFEELDPMQFMHSVGMWCVYMLIATIFSLIGVILMWRLEKVGFIIYAIAELSTNFFKLDMNGAEDKSYMGLIFMVIIDLTFIAMYYTNLKYMNKKSNSAVIQSES